MWLLIFTTQQAKRLEILLAAMNSGDYRRCSNVIYGNILDILRKQEKGHIKYMQLDTVRHEATIKENMTLKALPALVHIVGDKDEEIDQVYYESDILVTAFELPNL